MKKLPQKFTIPLMMLFMMPTMLLGLPAILTYRNLPEGAPFLESWLTAVGQTVPLALALVVVAGTLIRLLVTKVLVEAKIAVEK